MSDMMVCNLTGCSTVLDESTSVWGFCSPCFEAVMDAEDSEVPGYDWTPEPHPWCATCCCPPAECVHDPVQVPCTLPIPANVYDGMGCE